MRKILVTLFILLTQLAIFGQDYKFGKVSKQELSENFCPIDSTVSAAYLLKKRRSYFSFIASEGRFQLITDYHLRIKIYNSDGFKYATKMVSYYSKSAGSSEKVVDIKGYTFSLEEDKIIKEKLSKKGIFKEKTTGYYSRVKITMPTIKEGCVLELKYSIISPYATSVDDVQFQLGIPIKQLNTKIEIPEYYIFNTSSKGFYTVPFKKEYKNSFIGDINYTTNVYIFDAENIPALRDDEAYVANINNYRGGMKFELSQTNFISFGGIFKSYNSTWSKIAQEIFKSPKFGEELKKSSFLKEDLQVVLENATTESEKINAIFQFIKSKVKWNKNYGKYTQKGLKKAYKENSGNVADINLLLTAMLREAGLDANPVLVSSKGNGIPLFPTIKGYNYVISSVYLSDSSFVLLDATEPYSMPNLLPTRALNWNGRVITKEGGSSIVKLQPQKHAVEENFMSVKLTDNMEIEGMIRTKLTNLKALNYRKRKNHIKKETLIERYEENNNLEIDDFKVVNSSTLNKPIIRNVKFFNEDLVEEINGKFYVEPLLFLTKHKNPFKLKERKFPVDFTTPWKEVHKVSIILPKGYTVDKIPEPIAYGLPDNIGVFKYQVKKLGNRISTTAILQINESLVLPQYYTYLKDFYRDLVKKESEKIILSKI